MKSKSWKFSLATICIFGSNAFVYGQSCGVEGCDNKPSCKCHAKKCDDNGLLEVVNNVASSFEDRLARMLPAPTNQCKQPSCGCQHTHAGAAAPALKVVHKPGNNLPKVMPKISVEQIAPPAPLQPEALPYPAPVVQPNQFRQETIPQPDSQVNPFKDETTQRLRNIPASPASYLKPEASYGSAYDPQARVELKPVTVAPARVPASSSAAKLAAATSSRKNPLRKASEISVVKANATVEIHNPHFDNSLRGK
jgi:hypothetical protein